MFRHSAGQRHVAVAEPAQSPSGSGSSDPSELAQLGAHRASSSRTRSCGSHKCMIANDCPINPDSGHSATSHKANAATLALSGYPVRPRAAGLTTVLGPQGAWQRNRARETVTDYHVVYSGCSEMSACEATRGGWIRLSTQLSPAIRIRRLHGRPAIRKKTLAESGEGNKNDQEPKGHSPIHVLRNLSRKGVAALGAVLTAAVASVTAGIVTDWFSGEHSTTLSYTSSIFFQPWTLEGKVSGDLHVASRITGFCWEESVAARRADAYRCTAGNDILDRALLDPMAQEIEL